jgi:hypothetical protein
VFTLGDSIEEDRIVISIVEDDIILNSLWILIVKRLNWSDLARESMREVSELWERESRVMSFVRFLTWNCRMLTRRLGHEV